METALIILTDGIIYASWLFIVSVGLTLVFGVMRVVNLAHGSFYAIGAYTAATVIRRIEGGVTSPSLSLLLMAVSAVSVAVVVGPLIERGVLRFFLGRGEVVVMLVTYAILHILESAMLAIWGATPYYVADAYSIFGLVKVGAISYVGYDLVLIALAILVGLALHTFLFHTASGKLVTAVIHNAEVSSAMGVRVNRVFTVTFMIGVFLAALAGAFTSPMIAVQPGIGINVIIISFAVVIIGGLGSVQGAGVGALIVGLCRAAAIHVAPQAELFVIYAVMAFVLIFRPEGLFASPQARVI